MKTNRTLAIIPARGGSKRIPHKNILDFKGKPMIAYSILGIKEAEIADEIMVSTDDSEIAKVAEAYGAHIPFMRSKETSNDTSGIADVLLEVLEEYKKKDEYFQYVVCVLATAPLLQSRKLREAYSMLIDSACADSICSVVSFSYPPQRGLIIQNKELRMMFPENYSARSQDLEIMYHDCGQFFIFKTEALERDKMLYTRHSIPYMLSELETQDIDNFVDLEIARLKYEIIFNGGISK